MSASRSHYEAKLSALHEFHRLRFIGAPDGIFETIKPQLRAMRAAMKMMPAALPILLSLANKHGHRKEFHAYVLRVEGVGVPASVATETQDVAAGVPQP